MSIKTPLSDDERALLHQCHHHLGCIVASPKDGVSHLAASHASGGGWGFDYEVTKTALRGSWCRYEVTERMPDGSPKRLRFDKPHLIVEITLLRIGQWARGLPDELRARAVTAWATYPVDTRNLGDLEAIVPRGNRPERPGRAAGPLPGAGVVMKALTVQQPWAWAIMHGGKDIENRTQNWRYRGPLAIHAGRRMSDRGMDSPLVQKAATGRTGPGCWDGGIVTRRPFEILGAIIGTVDLVDVHPEAGCCGPWGESAYVEHGGRERRSIMHLVLENPIPLAVPIPCVGALGLWPVPARVLAELEGVAAHGLD